MRKINNEVKYRYLTELTELEGNPRTITREKMQKLVDSIKANPDYFEARPIICSDRTGKLVILAGNQRYKAAKIAGIEEVPVIILHGLSEEKEREIIIRDNVELGDWDMGILANEWDADLLKDWGVDINWDEKSYSYDDYTSGSLVSKFMVPPMSVLDTRQGYWQDRKRQWLSLGIKSEVGRNDDLLGLDAIVQRDRMKLSGTSIFDPLLCELMYRWFCTDGGSILDPFAGGSVRGIVATKLGYDYTGIELRKEQVESNIENANSIELEKQPIWINGDSNAELDKISTQFDMIMSCPPYADLEVYSDDPSDLSNMPYDKFIETYRSIIKKAVDKLKEDSFAVFVVGEVRDKKTGEYIGFVKDTMNAFMDAGAVLYNEAVIINAGGTAGLRAGRYFNISRKLCKTHQNILVFYKGNTKNIKQKYPELDFSGVENIDETE